MYRTHKQPVGRPTRGKTAAVRLRRLDRLLLTTEEPLFRRRDGAWRDAALVDLGYGERPTTTLELAADARRYNPDLLVIGVEIDPERVAAAKPAEDARTRFRRGGFELPLNAGETVRCIRAMNVLRQYGEDAVPDAHRALVAALLDGGLLAEGTSDPTGARMVVNLLRRRADGPPEHRVAFGANLRHPLESPRDLQPVLPKNLIHRVVPGEAVYGLMEGWDRAWRQTHAAATFGPRVHFAAAGRALMELRPDVERRPGLLREGWLVWRPV